MNKWEARFDRVMEWFDRRNPSVQALVALIFYTTVAVLAIAVVVSIIALCVTLLGWWNLVFVPALWMYLFLYTEFYDNKKRRGR